MQAGKLRNRIELQAPSYSRDSMGAEITTYATKATVWGAVRPLSGSLYFTAKQADSSVSGEVEIRYRIDITPTWRLKIGERILSIVTIIDPENRHEKLWIKYSEGLD
jgi:SPP1 family predicted phage head-tail adaptor